MSENDPQTVKIPIGEMRVGHFVDLQCSWMGHPFLFSRFLITSPAEIAAIREMGRTEVVVLPDLSRLAETSETPPPATEVGPSIRQELLKRKQAMMNSASTFRDERQQAATRYHETVKKLTAFSREVRTAPANAVH